MYLEKTGLGHDSKWFTLSVYDGDVMIGWCIVDEKTKDSIEANDPIIIVRTIKNEKVLMFETEFEPCSILCVSNELSICRCQFKSCSKTAVLIDLNSDRFADKMVFDNEAGIVMDSCILEKDACLSIEHNKVNFKEVTINRGNAVSISTDYDPIYFLTEAEERTKEGEHSLYPSVNIIKTQIGSGEPSYLGRLGKVTITTCPMTKSNMKFSHSEVVDHFLSENECLKSFVSDYPEPGFLIYGSQIICDGSEIQLNQEWIPNDLHSSFRTVIIDSELKSNAHSHLLMNVASVISSKIYNTTIRGNANVIKRNIWCEDLEVSEAN